MLAQRPAGRAARGAGRRRGAAVPRPRRFDAAMAVLTLHHWTDQRAGIAEVRRVAPRLVVVTFDTDVDAVDRHRLPAGDDRPGRLRVPADRRGRGRGSTPTSRSCPSPTTAPTGSSAPYWARPELYLDPQRRAGMSVVRKLDPAVVDAGDGPPARRPRVRRVGREVGPPPRPARARPRLPAARHAIVGRRVARATARGSSSDDAAGTRCACSPGGRGSMFTWIGIVGVRLGLVRLADLGRDLDGSLWRPSALAMPIMALPATDPPEPRANRSMNAVDVTCRRRSPRATSATGSGASSGCNVCPSPATASSCGASATRPG